MRSSRCLIAVWRMPMPEPARTWKTFGKPWPRRPTRNRNHVTTPLDRRLSTEQTITVTDPRHPLCGRTLTLIGMTYHPELGQCCVVWLRPQIVRLVPVSATHVAFDPNAI